MTENSAVVKIANLKKHFGSNKAVDDISLQIDKGQIYGFLGPNGAGKTTTIRCMMDFIRPTDGNITIFGKKMGEAKPELKNKIGFLPSDNSLYDNWDANNHIHFVASARGISTDKGYKLAKDFGLDLQTKAKKLSTGNRQKLSLVVALMHNPELLILDEPTRGLDPLLQEEVHSYLLEFKKGGGSVFLSSHDFSEVERVCDKIGIIRSGKLVASETIQSLLKKQVHTVKVLFSQKYDPADFELSTIEIISQSANKIVMNVSGDLNDFLKLLNKYKLGDLEVSHLSLEDAFLRFYDD